MNKGIFILLLLLQALGPYGGFCGVARADETQLKKSLRIAIQDGDLNLVKKLLVEANAESQAHPESTSLVRILKDPSIDTQQGKINLVSYSACLKGSTHAKILTSLLEAGSEAGLSAQDLGSTVKPSGYQSLLHFAAERGNHEAMKILIGKVPLTSTATQTLFTPLHSAAQSGSSEAVHFLINQEQDLQARQALLKAKTSYGSTPIDIAFFANQPESFLSLLALLPKEEAAAYLDQPDRSGKNLFWRAVLGGHEAIANALFDRQRHRLSIPPGLDLLGLAQDVIANLHNPLLLKEVLGFLQTEYVVQQLGMAAEIVELSETSRERLKTEAFLKGISKDPLSFEFEKALRASPHLSKTNTDVLVQFLKDEEIRGKREFFLRYAYDAFYPKSKSGAERELTPVVGSCGTCFEDGKALHPECPAGNPRCNLRYCQDCAGDSLSFQLKQNQKRPVCQKCLEPIKGRYYEESHCSEEALKPFRELQVRFAEVESIKDWKFCRNGGCLAGAPFPAGELHHYKCSLCPFVGCLDCGKSHPTEGYATDGKCIHDDERAKMQRFYRVAAERGRLKAHSAHTPEQIVKLAEKHVPGTPCPICRQAVNGDHLVSDHLLDGIHRPCANCGMMTEKVPFFRPGGACNHMICKKENGGCGADYSFHRGLLTPLDPIQSNEEMQYEPNQPAWWPGEKF